MLLGFDKEYRNDIARVLCNNNYPLFTLAHSFVQFFFMIFLTLLAVARLSSAEGRPAATISPEIYHQDVQRSREKAKVDKDAYEQQIEQEARRKREVSQNPAVIATHAEHKDLMFLNFGDSIPFSNS